MTFKNLCLQSIYNKTGGNLLVGHHSVLILDLLLDQTVPLLHHSEPAFLMYRHIAQYNYRNAMFLMQEACSIVDDENGEEENDDSPIPMGRSTSSAGVPVREDYPWIYTGHPFFSNFISAFETLLEGVAEERELIEELILHVINKSAPQELTVNLLWLYFSISYHLYIDRHQYNSHANIHEIVAKIHSHMILIRIMH